MPSPPIRSISSQGVSGFGDGIVSRHNRASKQSQPLSTRRVAGDHVADFAPSRLRKCGPKTLVGVARDQEYSEIEYGGLSKVRRFRAVEFRLGRHSS